MNVPEPNQDIVKLTPQEQEVFKYLSYLGEPPASFFYDACILMHGQVPLKTNSHLIAHLLREVEGFLIDVLTQGKKVEKEEDGRNKNINIGLTNIGVPLDSELARAWRKSNSLHALAHRAGLYRIRSTDIKFQQLWQQTVDIFAVLLKKMEENYVLFFQKIEDLSQRQLPTKDDFKELTTFALANPLARSYFFEKAISSEWLNLKSFKALFEHPPAPVVSGENLIRFPIWYELKYLKKFAIEKPDIVTKIILSIPPTNNHNVHEEIIDIAKILPLENSIKITTKEVNWIREQNYLHGLIPHRTAELIVYLIQNGASEIGLILFATLFSIRYLNPLNGEITKITSYDPKAKFDEWSYGEILKEMIPQVMNFSGLILLDILCALLSKSVEYSIKSKANKEPEDYSSIWWSNIEGNEFLSGNDLREILTGFCRDLALGLVKQGIASLEEVIMILELRNWLILKRISLYVMAKSPKSTIVLTKNYIFNREVFDNRSLSKEFIFLLSTTYSYLSTNEQASLLKWIEEGPNRENVKSFSSEESYLSYKEFWQFQRLNAIEEFLPDETKKYYESIAPKFIEMQNTPGYVSWQGPTSSLSLEDLRKMSFEEIINYLRTWVPSNDLFDDSLEGLKRILESFIAENPIIFIGGSSQFQALRPEYCHALLSGLTTAITQGKIFEWKPVLDFAYWVVCKKDLPENPTDSHDYPWSWLGAQVGRLLEEGLKAKSNNPILFDLRELVWSIVEKITNSPDPTPEYEAQYGGENMNPFTMSINTTRGVAFHTLIYYAIWTYYNLAGTYDAYKSSFDEMPEVKEVLENHLDPTKDPSLSVRAVYGQSIPTLMSLDQDWTIKYIPKIFPSETEQKGLRDAAWSTFLITTRPDKTIFNALRSEYQKSVNDINTINDSVVWGSTPKQKFIQHLVTLYWWATIDIVDETDLLSQFFSKVSVENRHYALEYIGLSLSNTTGDIPAEVLQRLMNLWKWRLTKVIETDSDYLEITSFGIWFTSNKFNAEWGLLQLKQALTIYSVVDNDAQVLTRLNEVFIERPIEVLECIFMIIRGVQEPWRIALWKSPLQEILRNSVRSASEQVKILGGQVINLLIARNYIEFKDLLN